MKYTFRLRLLGTDTWWNLMKKIINILWQDNQTKTERKRKEDKWHAPFVAPPFPMCKVHLHYTLTRSPQHRRTTICEKKLTPFFRCQHCNIVILWLIYFFFISYKGLHSPKTCLYMHNWKKNLWWTMYTMLNCQYDT